MVVDYCDQILIINVELQFVKYWLASELIFVFIFLWRPLHVAARNGLTVVVQELLAKGASVLAVDENGKFIPFFF